LLVLLVAFLYIVFTFADCYVLLSGVTAALLPTSQPQWNRVPHLKVLLLLLYTRQSRPSKLGDEGWLSIQSYGPWTCSHQPEV